jgi:hypothetical protein
MQPWQIGFFLAHPSGADPAADPSHSIHEFQWVHLPDLAADQVWFRRVNVARVAGTWQEHLVVWPQPPLSAEVCDQMARLLTADDPGVPVCCVLSSDWDWGKFQCEIHTTGAEEAAAAAVAEAVRSTTFDDLTVIQVVVGSRSLDVHIRWIGDRTDAEIFDSAG